MWHDLLSYFGKHDSVIGYILAMVAPLYASRVAILKILDDREARKEARAETERTRRQEEEKKQAADAEQKIIAEVSATSLRNAVNSDLMARAIMDALTAALIVAGDDNKIIHWNDAACALFGWTEREAVGRPITFIMPEDLRGIHLAGMERYKRTGEAHIIGQTVNLRGLHKSGRQIAVTLSLSEGSDVDGKKFFVGLLFATPPPLID